MVKALILALAHLASVVGVCGNGNINNDCYLCCFFFTAIFFKSCIWPVGSGYSEQASSRRHVQTSYQV
jgi:hypothetical protein